MKNFYLLFHFHSRLSPDIKTHTHARTPGIVNKSRRDGGDTGEEAELFEGHNRL